MDNKPLSFFKEITAIPRDSGDERRIAEYLMGFAKKRGLAAEMDSVCNVVIRKSGTPGYTGSPTLVLQNHTDMVYIKDESCTHDYHSPLVLIEKDGRLSADGTSLGGDNGMGMAYALALLDSRDLPHPPLEALFTTEEETGMLGATSLSPGAITGRRMINLDSEEEGVFTAGCAGGIRSSIARAARWVDSPAGYKSYQLSIFGLLGGHSGMEIDRGRGNAIRLLGRILHAAVTRLGAKANHLQGGSKMNAIPDRAQAVVLAEDGAALESLVAELAAAFQQELSASDPGVTVRLEPCESAKKVLEDRVLSDVLLLLMDIPVGVQSMSMHLKGLVESSNNIGILTCTGEAVTVDCAIRSATRSLKYFIRDQLQLLSDAANAVMTCSGDYPEWSFAPQSPLRDKAAEVYTRMYGKAPRIIAGHGGLECGFFNDLFPEMDMISTGPNLYDVHTPKESMDLASAGRVWEWLVELIAALKD